MIAPARPSLGAKPLTVSDGCQYTQLLKTLPSSSRHIGGTRHSSLPSASDTTNLKDDPLVRDDGRDHDPAPSETSAVRCPLLVSTSDMPLAAGAQADVCDSIPK
eukprot:3533252-Prymnesium_polylepis.1